MSYNGQNGLQPVTVSILLLGRLSVFGPLGVLDHGEGQDNRVWATVAFACPSPESSATSPFILDQRVTRGQMRIWADGATGEDVLAPLISAVGL